MHEAVAAIAGCGVSPVVRIAANEGWMVKRALDAGGGYQSNFQNAVSEDGVANRDQPMALSCLYYRHQRTQRNSSDRLNSRQLELEVSDPLFLWRNLEDRLRHNICSRLMIVC